MKPHPTDAPCPLLRVADSGLGNVAFCQDCGAVHLTVQCLTVRLDPRAFMELVGMVHQARGRLCQIAHAAGSEKTRDDGAAIAEPLPEALH